MVYICICLILTLSLNMDRGGPGKYIYLSSLENIDIFNNTASAFQNIITATPLNPSLNYEIALLNVLYPKKFNVLTRDDAECGIDIIQTHITETGISTETVVHNFLPKNDVLSTDTGHIIEEINRQLTADLKTTFRVNYSSYFLKGKILSYDAAIGRVVVSARSRTVAGNKAATLFKAQFKPRIARVLGLSSTEKYYLFRSDVPEGTSLLKQIGPFKPDPTAGVDYVLIYSDIVEPQIYGSQLVNILDAFAFQESYSKGAHPMMYKPLCVTKLDKIAIKMTDQFGRNLSFESGHSTTVVLHVRPINK